MGKQIYNLLQEHMLEQSRDAAAKGSKIALLGGEHPQNAEREGKRLAKKLKLLNPEARLFAARALAIAAGRLSARETVRTLSKAVGKEIYDILQQHLIEKSAQATARGDEIMEQGGELRQGPEREGKRLAGKLKSLEPKARLFAAHALAVAACRLSPGETVIALNQTESELTKRNLTQETCEAIWRILAANPKITLASQPQHSELATFRRQQHYHYVPDFYGASAAKLDPLKLDPLFEPLAQAAIDTNRCLLYFDRLYTLFQCLLQARKVADDKAAGEVIEVGVYKGGSSYFLASAITALKMNTSLSAYDTFSGHDGADIAPSDRHSVGQFSDANVDEVRALLAPFPFVRIFIGRVQDFSGDFPDTISLAHLDTDLYEPTLFGLTEFFPRLSVGCSIVVDDYGSQSCGGIKAAVDEFAKSGPPAFILPLLTGQCVIVRTDCAQ